MSYMVFIIGFDRTHIDMTTNDEQKARLRVLELEHSGELAYYDTVL